MLLYVILDIFVAVEMPWNNVCNFLARFYFWAAFCSLGHFVGLYFVFPLVFSEGIAAGH